MEEKQVLLVTTTGDFLLKFQREEVKLLQRMGYLVHYAANFHEPPYVQDRAAIEALGVKTHQIPIARSPFLFRDNLRALEELLALLDRYPIGALHCHTPVGGVLGRLAGRLYQKRQVVVLYTAHGFHFYRGAPLKNWLAYYPVERWLARYTDLLAVINQEDYRAARHFRLKPGGSLWRLPGVGLDRGKFHPPSPEKRRKLRRELGIGEEEFFLVSAGELNENKNHQVILEAMALLRERDPARPLPRYAICGEGFARPRLEEAIRRLGLEGRAELWGHRRDMPRLLACADATAFPSRREGLGMAGVESLAMGVPVLAADNRGTREYMEQGVNGFLCPWDDPEAFAAGMAALRGLGPEEREAMARRCVDAARPFDKKYAAAVMARAYREMDRKVREKRYGQPSSDQRGHGGVPA